MDNRNERKSDYGDVNLNFYGVLRRSPKNVVCEISLRVYNFILHVRLDLGSKEAAHGIDLRKAHEIVVDAVKYALGAGFIGNCVYALHVIHPGFRSQHERRDLRIDIKKRVEPDFALCLAEPSPFKQYQTQAYRR